MVYAVGAIPVPQGNDVPSALIELKRRIMETRFKQKSQIIDVAVTAVAAVLSVGIMLYGVSHFGFGEAWPELVLNLCYIACLVMMGLYFFKRLDSQRFNYWSSICAGITALRKTLCKRYSTKSALMLRFGTLCALISLGHPRSSRGRQYARA